MENRTLPEEAKSCVSTLLKIRQKIKMAAQADLPLYEKQQFHDTVGDIDRCVELIRRNLYRFEEAQSYLDLHTI